MVSVRAALRVKSAATAPSPGAADTVTVTASLDAPESRAVTAAAPPDSEIDGGDRISDSVGVGSSSTSVRTTFAGDAAGPLVTRAPIVTRLSGWSTASSRAVTTIAPVLAVRPAAMVRLLALPE